MKVKEFIDKLNQFEYTDDTELVFGFINDGEFYEIQAKSVDDEDMQAGYNDLVVTFNEPIEYIKGEAKIELNDCREDLLKVIHKYM